MLFTTANKLHKEKSDKQIDENNKVRYLTQATTTTKINYYCGWCKWVYPFFFQLTKHFFLLLLRFLVRVCVKEKTQCVLPVCTKLINQKRTTFQSHQIDNSCVWLRLSPGYTHRFRINFPIFLFSKKGSIRFPLRILLIRCYWSTSAIAAKTNARQHRFSVAFSFPTIMTTTHDLWMV